MDIFQYINSKDIRAHLESIGYRFNALEAAWLVYQCHTATMKEKHAAWREIIDTMPDMDMPIKQEDPPKSLHAFLRNYMALEDRFLREFYDTDGQYAYNYYEPEYYYDTWKCDLLVDHHGIYYRLDECLKEALEKAKDYYKACEAVVYRIDLTNGNRIRSDFDQAGNIRRVCPRYDLFITEEQIFFDTFSALAKTISFPLPFRKGDILYYRDDSVDYCGDPFVLTATAAAHDNETVRLLRDGKGVILWGYFQHEDGTLYREWVCGYTNLEWYKGTLRGKNRILKALSNYYKGKIDAVLFANAYRQILTEEQERSFLPYHITEEERNLAGLQE